MKICSNCNSQFDDNTIFCSTCGSRLDAQQNPQPQYSQPQFSQPQYSQPQYAQPQYAPPTPPAPKSKSNEPNKASVILGFIGRLACIISAFFALCAIATPYIRVSVNTTYSNIYAYAYFRPEEACSVISFLFALAALALVTVSAIMVFTKRPKTEVLFSKISGIALSFFLMIFTIVLMANM